MAQLLCRPELGVGGLTSNKTQLLHSLSLPADLLGPMKRVYTMKRVLHEEGSKREGSMKRALYYEESGLH